MYLFFLFKQKTADERRMSDWGSDVCSSYLDRCVSLPPVEARLTAALLDRYGAVVSRDALARAGWPNGSPGRNALDVHVLRLRRRVAPLTSPSGRCAPGATCPRAASNPHRRRSAERSEEPPSELQSLMRHSY